MSSLELLDPFDLSTPEHTGIVPASDQLRSQSQLADTVEDIGNLTCIKSRGIIDGNGFSRIRHSAVMFVAGYQYALRVTEPASRLVADTEGMVGMFPGFMQDHEYGGARSLHSNVATEYPGRRIVTVSSNGYNKNGSPLTWREIGTSFNEMAMGRLLLMRQLSNEEETILGGLSKGTVLSHLMAELNRENPIIDHTYSLNHSPAVVPPEKVMRDMALRFTGSICVDAAKEAVRHPREAWKALHIPSLRVLPAYVCDVYNLLHGTPEAGVHELARRGVKTGVVAGDKDPLAQLDMWGRVQAAYPDNIEILVRPGQGHALSMNAREAAQDIRTVHEKLLTRAGAIACS